MKKNKPLRVAGILLIATMLTTSMVSGTFAKYTTTGSAVDSARVAKFGVTVTADGSLFGEEYNPVGDGSGNSNGIIAYSAGANTGTVQVSATGTDVVAPGTKNDTGLGFSVNGKPEVDVTLEGSTITTKNVYLKAGTYGVMVKAEGITSVNFDTAGDLYTETSGTYTKAAAYATATDYYKLQDAATLAADYYPVVFTLSGDTAYDSGTTASDSLAEIAALITGKLDVSTVRQANTDLADTALNLDNEVLKWEWKFEETGNTTDGADTILGDLAAKGDTTFAGTVVKLDGTSYVAPVADTDYNLDVEFDLTLTVTQVD